MKVIHHLLMDPFESAPSSKETLQNGSTIVAGKSLGCDWSNLLDQFIDT
jgi:hypothetical protein